MRSCASKCDRVASSEPDRVNDRQLARRPERCQRSQPRVEREHVVEPDAFAFLDAQGGPGAVVRVVGDRRDERQAVGTAAEEDHDEGSVARSDAGDEAEGDIGVSTAGRRETRGAAGARSDRGGEDLALGRRRSSAEHVSAKAILAA